MRKKKEEDAKGKEETLLHELCGADAELYACLSTHLYESPLAAISQRDLETLTEEAGKSGNFRPALDKAIFEGAQNPGESERYIRAIQNLASKTIHTMEQERERAEKEGLTDLAASLGRGIENQRLMSERAGDILNVASKFYSEKMLDLKDQTRRETREEDRKKAAREETRILGREKTDREARREARRGMARDGRRAAKKQDAREARAADERREARKQKRQDAETEETRIGQSEEERREARREERRGE